MNIDELRSNFTCHEIFLIINALKLLKLNYENLDALNLVDDEIHDKYIKDFIAIDSLLDELNTAWIKF